MKVGRLVCKVCGTSFDTEIHKLCEPIDVYAEWIDVRAPRPTRSAALDAKRSTTAAASALTPLPATPRSNARRLTKRLKPLKDGTVVWRSGIRVLTERAARERRM